MWQYLMPYNGVRNGNALQYSCLENSMDRRAWQATVHGVAKNRTWLRYFHFVSRKAKTQLEHKNRFVLYEEGAVTDWICQKWLVKFHVGGFWQDDAPWLGRPVEVDSDQVKTLTENSQHYTMQEIANILKISKSSIENHLYQLGYVHHFYVWVPHKLSKNLLNHISAYDSLLKHNEDIPFLKQIVTGNEKWLLSNNEQWNRSWGKWNEPLPTTPKAGLDLQKAVLCIW